MIVPQNIYLSNSLKYDNDTKFQNLLAYSKEGCTNNLQIWSFITCLKHCQSFYWVKLRYLELLNSHRIKWLAVFYWLRKWSSQHSLVQSQQWKQNNVWNLSKVNDALETFILHSRQDIHNKKLADSANMNT